MKYLLLPLLLLLALQTLADVRLPKLFGDHMVLQRRKPVPIWGWADPGEKLAVVFNGQTKKIKTGKDGRWRTNLDPMEAGGPFELTVQGKTNSAIVQDVLVGEVWVCSGQSNMEWVVKNSTNSAEEIQKANYPQIRHFKVQKATAVQPLSDVSGEWQVCSPASVSDFTAVGYFFARDLARKLNVPIGLMNTSWGGTHSETWTSREAMESDSGLRGAVARIPAFSDTLTSIKNKPNLYGTLLYNAMINPLIPMAMQGVIWYQGESNAGRAYQYQRTFPLLIQDWRTGWNRQEPSAGSFPFLFVQLANFTASNGNSQKGSTWAELREAQTMTLQLPNTGMAVTSDIGEPKDIHPKNKQDVGKRLAAEAMRVVYKAENTQTTSPEASPGRNGAPEASPGPMFGELKTEGNRAILTFKTVGSGLITPDKYGYLKGFEVAGSDQKFYFARAEIQGNTVIVYCPEVANPVAVRYGWADENGELNLYNKEGFPAVPFRTDTWKGITEGKRF